jgi:predicted transcriptional regulator
MTPKLTSEQLEALRADGAPLPVEDESTKQVYFLVDRATLESADRDSIRRGIADMEAGRVITLEELDARIQAAIRRPKSA